MLRKAGLKSIAAAVLVVGAVVAAVGGQWGPGGSVAMAQAGGGGEAGEHAVSYEVDGVHSSVIFKIMHANLAPFMGRFNEVSGTINIDPADPAASFMDIAIDTASVDTNNGSRDDHVRSGDFLNVKQFPQATFKTKRMESGGEKTLIAVGDFTIHGVTKEISVPVHLTGKGEMRGQHKIGMFAEFTFKRSDHGMEVGQMGDEVEMMVGLEAAKR